MKYRRYSKIPKNLAHFMLVAFLATAGTPAIAGDSPLHQIVNGTAIYIGVTPAEVIQGHIIHMHGGVPNPKHRYHLLVALFDDVTGERITDAQVSAAVTPLGLTGEEKALERMIGFADAITYGNYFRMPDAGQHIIKVSVQRTDGKHPITADFMFDRPRE